MNRFLKSASIIILAAALLTSCNNNNSQNNPSPTAASSVTTTASPAASETSASPESSSTASATSNPDGKKVTPGSINKFSDLFSVEHALNLKKSSDSSFFSVSQVLLYSIADLLGKAELLDTSTPEGKSVISRFDKKKYDYVLQFDGAKPIMVSIKDNLVYFDGENEVYQLWADSKNLWENITFDTAKKTADIKDKGLEIQQKSFDADINSDGKIEKVSLIYKAGKGLDFKGDLILRVANSDAVVLKQTQWQINPSRTISQPPTVFFMPQKDSKNKIIIVTLTWFTGSTEASGDVFAYIYKNGKVSDLELKAPETLFKYSGGNTVKIEFPETKSYQVVKFDATGYSKLIEQGKTLNDLFKDSKAFTNNPLYFKLEDYDGDGSMELCSMSTLMFESLGRMSMGFQYTFYKGSIDQLKPAKVIIAPPFIDKDKDIQVERYIMSLIFDYKHLTIINNTIKDSWYKPSNQFKKEEIMNGITRLINDKKLYMKGNIVYVNVG
ncbi:MAG: hypothetical protein Q8942_18000 [Bacillota bacterium]|nr:hypothetical protein [Bacillota bacterium]